MFRTLPAAVALLALLAAGCTSTTDPRAAGSTAPSGDPSGSASVDPSATADPTGSGRGTVAEPTGSPSPAGSTRRAGTRKGDPFVLEVELNTECASGGTTMIATVETWPDVSVAFAAAYNDPDYFPDFHWVPREGNPTGSVLWTWEITPMHPTGPAELSVVAGNAKGGGSERLDFVVATAC